MAQIDRAYVALALALLIVGEAARLLHGNDDRHTSGARVHIVIVLVGFVTLAIFGMLFRLWPAMKQGALAKAQFWLTVIGLAGVDRRQHYADVQVAPSRVLAASSAVMIVGALIAGVAVLGAGDGVTASAETTRGPRRGEPEAAFGRRSVAHRSGGELSLLFAHHLPKPVHFSE